MNKNFESFDVDTTIQLCCIEIRRFFRDMTQIALDKKSNFEYLEKEVGLQKFLPRNVIINQVTILQRFLNMLIQVNRSK